ncbi:MAG TPA: zinc ribbon domain-containing protein [Candidatus Saccharimonadales bacterium]|nr:zinc ribbon domain-containing protein [Candidatus Saccharimonadales bacterium]
MPIYDYVCTTCGHRMEVVHGVNASGPGACPVCGGMMRKAIAAPAVHFKGSGWAKKERRSSATAASAKAAGEPGPDGKPEPATSDAKPGSNEPVTKDGGDSTSSGTSASPAPTSGSGSATPAKDA